MPETVAEVYTVATQAMLARTGAGAADLTPLLQAVFVEAHTRQQRVITRKHIEEAANKLGRLGMMDALLRLVKQDRMPLLTLLQVQPLELQAAHLSFQEFFVARALCANTNGRELALPKPPWELDAWWSNTVRLGVEMGDAFGTGLLASCRGALVAKTASVALRGHKPTAASALASAVRSAPEVEALRVGAATLELAPLRRTAESERLDLAERKLGADDALVLCALLERDGNPRLTALDLAGNRIGGAGLQALASIPTLTEVDVRRNHLRETDLEALGRGLLGRQACSLAGLRCDAFELPASAPQVQLDFQSLRAAHAVLIAGLARWNEALRELRCSAPCLQRSPHTVC